VFVRKRCGLACEIAGRVDNVASNVSHVIIEHPFPLIYVIARSVLCDEAISTQQETASLRSP
jgi:hypothetical protein